MKTGPHAPPLRGSLPPEGARVALGRPGGDTPSIYLASQSPRRRELLTQWGVAHELLLPGADEDAEALEAAKPREAPAAYVQRVTALKLEAAMARLKQRGLPAAPVLCADTTVALGRRILGKPADAAEARRMLADLSGRAHRVLTAVAVGKGRRRWSALSVSTVHFQPLTATQIRRYVEGGEPMGKAGAYAIQGHAGLWVSRIQGSHTGIIGLPAFETAQLLRAAGLPIL
ncbi:MAG: septum formation inhibitor Maf [Hydrogenophaga sp.]|uniref:dTTP/UTP pyrophosphatase n=1 Tax=Hydrogenophaga crocea TaxID=2716225 RepID=A0A6G8IFA3_9BURK|nr:MULTISPECIES: Maf family protein [Hydrogenophaga]MBL0944082.1 septum formation inhibitor Maf [Hydrogenophaga sp.]QIM51823.1 septum formation inhibitor Maf [Hydrogenophaga crocea]